MCLRTGTPKHWFVKRSMRERVRAKCAKKKKKIRASSARPYDEDG